MPAACGRSFMAGFANYWRLSPVIIALIAGRASGTPHRHAFIAFNDECMAQEWANPTNKDQQHVDRHSRQD